MSGPTPGAEGGGPVDEIGVDLGPDESRGLLDGWTGTGERTGERTGALGADQDAAHARLAALAEAGALLRSAGGGVAAGPAGWLQTIVSDPPPLDDGLPPPPLPAYPDGLSEVTALGQHPFWSAEGLAPEGRPTDDGMLSLDERTDALGGAGRTHPGVSLPTDPSSDPGFTDPGERTQTRVRPPVAPAPGADAPPAWLLSVLGALVVILAGVVALLLLGR